MISDSELEDLIEEAELLFHCNGAEVLTPICTAINRQQPEFTPIAYSWRGLTVEEVELLFETTLVLYHALSNLAKIKFRTLKRHTLTNNISAFSSFIRYYNLEAEHDTADPDTMLFIQNPVLLQYSTSCLAMIDDVPAPVMASYMAIIKAIDDHLLKTNTASTPE